MMTGMKFGGWHQGILEYHGNKATAAENQAKKPNTEGAES